MTSLRAVTPGNCLVTLLEVEDNVVAHDMLLLDGAGECCLLKGRRVGTPGREPNSLSEPGP